MNLRIIKYILINNLARLHIKKYYLKKIQNVFR